MSFFLRMSASVLAAACFLAVMPVSGEHHIYTDVLRLHVIAESDSEEDQALKLQVRDAVLTCVSDAVAACTSFDEAYAVVMAMQDEIRDAALACVRANGSDCCVTVTLAPEKYPRRDYGAACLPAGVYSSLKVTLGSGAGKNWWCVLFPTVCLRFAASGASEDAYLAAGFTPEEYRVITGEGKWKVKFRILEILSGLFAA
ncbi:MAG: stage II sporulation protein R [Eubacteriales bacterium]